MNVEVGVHGKRRARAYNGFVIGTLSGVQGRGYQAFSLPKPFGNGSFRDECSFHSLELLLVGTFVLWNFKLVCVYFYL